MTKFVKNFKNTWSIKNPKYNLSKDEIRNVISEVGGKFKYPMIFGTPEDWEFDSSIISVKIENMSAEERLSNKFKEFANAVVLKYKEISNREIDFQISKVSQSYEDYNVSKFNYQTPVIKLKFK